MKDSGWMQIPSENPGSSSHFTKLGQYSRTAAQSFLIRSHKDRHGLMTSSSIPGKQIGKWNKQRKKTASLEQFARCIDGPYNWIELLANDWLRWPRKFGKRVRLYGRTRWQSGTLIFSHFWGGLNRNPSVAWKVIASNDKSQTQNILRLRREVITLVHFEKLSNYHHLVDYLYTRFAL